jgi:hypothetical protein
MLQDGLRCSDPALRDCRSVRDYALLGDKDEAFKTLFRQVEERNDLATYIKSDPPFESLHSDSRWT